MPICVGHEKAWSRSVFPEKENNFVARVARFDKNLFDMTTVTKKDLVTAIAGSTGVESEQVALIVNAMLSTMGDKLAEGAAITFRGLCTISVKIAAAKLGRNPNMPHEQIHIPERCVVQFKPSKELKDRVGKLPPERLRAR